jgi:hypothetical protein
MRRLEPATPRTAVGERAHAYFKGFNFRERGPRNHHQRDIALCQIEKRAVNMIRQERAVWATPFPPRTEHEVVNNELTSVRKIMFSMDRTEGDARRPYPGPFPPV